MGALALRNLSKSYENGAIGVHDLSIDVLEGELMVLVGPSGSGKSTTLRLIAGLESPTGGDIFIGGKCANDIPPRDRDIAMVFQDYALYPHLNVGQNMGFGLKMRGFSKEETHVRVMEASRLLGISDLMGRKPRELSGGQRQRVALGRALVRNPKVFLFDEPLSNLDASLRVQLRREIKDLHQKLGATMVYVTHDQGEAMTIGQRIAVMNSGAIEQVDTPSALYRKPESIFVAGFFGSPPMNLVECRAEIKENRLEICINDARLPFKLSEGEAGSEVPAELLIGFRPEDVHLADAPVSGSLTGSARVLSVEAMAGETVMQLEADTFRLAVRILGYTDTGPGSTTHYSVPPTKLHLFRSSTTRRIHVEPVAEV